MDITCSPVITQPDYTALQGEGSIDYFHLEEAQELSWHK